MRAMMFLENSTTILRVLIIFTNRPAIMYFCWLNKTPLRSTHEENTIIVKIHCNSFIYLRRHGGQCLFGFRGRLRRLPPPERRSRLNKLVLRGGGSVALVGKTSNIKIGVAVKTPAELSRKTLLPHNRLLTGLSRLAPRIQQGS